MKLKQLTILAVVFFGGMTIARLSHETTTLAEDPPEAEVPAIPFFDPPVDDKDAVGRYQISVLEGSKPQAFLLDTVTGRTWEYGFSKRGNPPNVIAVPIWDRIVGGPATYHPFEVKQLTDFLAEIYGDRPPPTP